jgi:hypothetical protein
MNQIIQIYKRINKIMNSEDRLIVFLNLSKEELKEYISDLTPCKFAELMNLANNRFMQTTYIFNDLSIIYSRYRADITPFREEFIFEESNYVYATEEEIRRDYNIYVILMNSLDILLTVMEEVKYAREFITPV